MYLWNDHNWPTFIWNESNLNKILINVSRQQARLMGRMEALGFDLRSEAHLLTLTDDVVKSSEIEGEHLAPDQVRSSIARRLDMDIDGLIPTDDHVEGMVEMMLDATGNYADTLTAERLFTWHAALFPPGRNGMNKMRVGRWRDDRSGPMQVVSGPLGHEKVHYQAPPADSVAHEMAKFLRWFERPGDIDPLLVAALAHLWFITIHPFEDGNGRIARAITDMALARSEKSSQRFYSLSAQIQRQHESYYHILESTQKGKLDVTAWQHWFLSSLSSAINAAAQTLTGVFNKAAFWERFAKQALNERQIKMLNKLLNGFEGKLTTSKWAKIAKCSQDTAYRDILNLIDLGALEKDAGGGRSTSYSVVLDNNTR